MAGILYQEMRADEVRKGDSVKGYGIVVKVGPSGFDDGCVHITFPMSVVKAFTFDHTLTVMR